MRIVFPLATMTVALTYHWWSLFVRLAHSNARLEAITSRPFLHSGVGRKTEHASQQHFNTTPLHDKNKQARDMLTRVNVLLPERKKLRSSSIRNRLAMRMPDHYHR